MGIERRRTKSRHRDKSHASRRDNSVQDAYPPEYYGGQGEFFQSNYEHTSPVYYNYQQVPGYAALPPSYPSQQTSDEMLFDGPAQFSSQVGAEYVPSYERNFGFSNDFFMSHPSGAAGGGVGLAPVAAQEPAAYPVGETPQFGASFPQPSPASSHGFPDPGLGRSAGPHFESLARLDFSHVAVDAAKLLDSLFASKDPLSDSSLSTGNLTGSASDKYYNVALALNEHIWNLLINEATLQLKTQFDSPQVAVFLRRIFMAVLCVQTASLESFVKQYHEEGSEWFFQTSDSSSGWDEQITARESKLHSLNAEIAELEAEVDAWRRVDQQYQDGRTHEFSIRKQAFVSRLNHIDEQAKFALSQGRFLVGGNFTPELPFWEHPELRQKRHVQTLLRAEMEDALHAMGVGGLDAPQVMGDMGIPSGGYCFEPGVVVDESWSRFMHSGWNMEEDAAMGDENRKSPVLTECGDVDAKRASRLSLDALRAFDSPCCN